MIALVLELVEFSGPDQQTIYVNPLAVISVRAPRGAEHFSWRIDILPRLTHLAGLELGAGVNLNIVAPERVAAELRDA